MCCRLSSHTTCATHAAVDVWVQLLGLLPVGCFDVIRCGIYLHTQHIVVVCCSSMRQMSCRVVMHSLSIQHTAHAHWPQCVATLWQQLYLRVRAYATTERRVGCLWCCCCCCVLHVTMCVHACMPSRQFVVCTRCNYDVSAACRPVQPSLRGKHIHSF